MAEQKTKPTTQNATTFLNQIEDEQQRKDCFKLAEIMEEIVGEKPVMWGAALVGFGTYHYKYASGHEGEAPLTGFAPRKQNISLYLMPGFTTASELLEKLGKHKAGAGCLYVKRLSDIDEKVLKQLIKKSVQHLEEEHQRL